MVHKHSVRDTGAHFIIDQYTRQIKKDSANKTTIVQYDHNSERLTFEMPLYIDGHAMTLCDLIEIHYINISTDGKSQNHGTYEVDDIKAEGENAVFTWLISQDCTQLAGSLNFFIVFKCTDNGVTVYRWGTEIYKNQPISEGGNNGEAILTEYPDILAQWKAQIFGASENAVLTVATAEANALAAIEAAGEAKKQSVLDSIPDEYEALSALADQNHRIKAGAIVLDAEGESIVVNDASEYPLQNLKVFGKSTQDGTPTPDAPVDIVSVGNKGSITSRVSGKNLFPVNEVEFEQHIYNPLGITYDAGKYSFSAVVESSDTDSEQCAVIFYVGEEEVVKSLFVNRSTNGERISFTTTVPNPFDTIRFYASNGWNSSSGDTAKFSEIMLEQGSEVSEYEPYSGCDVELSVDSGLHGLSTTVDEIDINKGVQVNRICRYVVTGEETMTNYELTEIEEAGNIRIEINGLGLPAPCNSNDSNIGLCTHFNYRVTNKTPVSCWVNKHDATGVGRLRFVSTKERFPTVADFADFAKAQYANGTPIIVMYAMETPIETPLSDAEITAFKALHSNKPNTTILNDAGAFMAVEYLADTKTYIDNKIKEIMEGVTA